MNEWREYECMYDSDLPCTFWTLRYEGDMGLRVEGIGCVAIGLF